MITFQEYERHAMTTAIYTDRGKNIYYPTLGLAGEAGEIANKVKKVMRDAEGELTEDMRNFIADEIGDCLWYLAALAGEIGKDLSTIAVANLDKLASRKLRGVIQGSGDTR